MATTKLNNFSRRKNNRDFCCCISDGLSDNITSKTFLSIADDVLEQHVLSHESFCNKMSADFLHLKESELVEVREL